MALEEYQRKRDFSRTPEPEAAPAAQPGRLFVVQKHAASRLHYDFRLELDGVLLSWAVPKGPSLDPGERRLAVHVEDHPVSYGDFEGIIPKGQYGGGTVMLWDRGEWHPAGDPRQGLAKGKLDFELRGEKLHGSWRLVRMGGRSQDDEDNWLLLKRHDGMERPGFDITEESPRSVASGRSLEEIAEQRDAVWRSNRQESHGGPAKERGGGPIAASDEGLEQEAGALEAARRGRPGKDFRPQLATLAAAVPEGEDWLHEIKLDGYRLTAHRSGSAVVAGVRLSTRNGKDWTGRFPQVARAVAALPVEELVLDGELVLLRPDGTSDFQALQNALGRDGAGVASQVVYVAFDLPFLGGYDLRKVALEQRKEVLRRLLEAADERVLRYSDHIGGGGEAVYTQACRLGLEGVISKRRASPYVSRRSRDWLKIKCLQRQELVIAGYTAPQGSRSGFGALLLGFHEDGGLRYAGKVGTGFDRRTLSALEEEMAALRRPDSPFREPPPKGEARGVRWIEPRLVAEVAFTDWTDEGRLRHPSFLGLRRDKSASEVVREVPTMRDESEAKHDAGGRGGGGRTAKARSKPQAKGETRIAGVRLSNPDRVLYPDQGITKLDLAKYYESVADHVLPSLVERPLSLVRCPQGRASKCFYQKHLVGSLPPAVQGVEVEEKAGETAVYIMIRDLAGLISLVQMGALELHPWGSRNDRLERPDRLIFDLDPDPELGWSPVVEAARTVRARLGELGLASFVRTTGGKGLHVVVPLVRRSGWDEAKAFARAVAEDLSRRSPDRFLARAAKAERRGRIFIDYLRNGRGATAIASYSTRARPGATVATPLRWDELESLSGGDRFDIESVPRRLRSLAADPWQGFDDLRQSITVAMRRSLGA